MRRLRLLAACILPLALCGCPEQPGRQFAEHSAGLGLGISFGDERGAVQSVLGAPRVSTERDGYAEDHYVPPFQGNPPKMPDLRASQLTLTYVNGRLTRVYNHYDPADPGAPVPPHLIEPAPGARLGARRSQFETALGPGNYGPLNDAWRFTSGDGRALLIQAVFVEVPTLGSERLCSTISMAIEEETAGRGEYYEKQQERKQRVKNL